jgi:hypothetical protein
MLSKLPIGAREIIKDKLYFCSHKSRPTTPQGFTLINTDEK